MFKSDAKYFNRKWRNPDAERRWSAADKKQQAQYSERCDKLASLIARTVEQRHVNGYLHASDIWTLLLQLKEEVDRMPGGFKMRQPWPDRPGTEGERAQFMSDAVKRALGRNLIKIHPDSDQSLFWLYVEHKAPKWLVFRGDGQVIAIYGPTKEELTIPEEGFDAYPERTLTDHQLRRFRDWGEPVDLSA